MPGAGSIYHLETGAFIGTIKDGDAAGLAAAKAACALGGLIQLGPGTEGIPLGGGWVSGAVGVDPAIALVRIDALGNLRISGFHVADLQNPEMCVHLDCSIITVERAITLPDWSGILPLPIDFGASGRFLRSNGSLVQPSWEVLSVSNALLDGVNHTDTVARAVARGALVVGTAGPVWDRLTIGPANSVLSSDGTDVGWTVNPAVQHDTLAHLKPFSVANVSWANGSADLTHAANGFANVRVGDFIFLGTNTTFSTQGARVLSKTNDNLITADLTKDAGDAALVNVTALFQPGDHWDNALALDLGVGAGLFLTMGRGTYSSPSRTAGTFQEIRGPIRWRPHNLGNLVSDFRAQASASTVTPSGFALEEAVGGSLAYFYLGLLTGDRVYSFPNLGGQIIVEGATQTLTNKTLDTSNKISVDGTATRTVFSTGGGADRMAFNVDNMTALRQIIWQNYAGSVAVWGAPVTFADGDTSPTVSRGNIFRTANTGATTITTFDDSVDGQEITIVFGDANTTIQAGASMKLFGGLDFVSTADDTLTLVRAGATVFYEKCRSVNA